jgi:hypothetical protein
MNLMSDLKDASAGPRVEPVWDQKPPAWDEVSARGTSGWLAGISGADWLLYGAVAAIAVGIGIVNALSKAQDVAWHGGVYDARTPLFWEMTSIATILLLAPLLFAAIKRIRHLPGWPQRIAIAVAVIVIFSTLHIAGRVGLRKFVLWLAGSSYDFRFSVATLIYEFRKDVVTCLLIGGPLWLFDSRREVEQFRAASASVPAAPLPAAPHMVWLRDGSTRIRIEPGEILWISSAGNYVEYSLADSVHHLVRGTLAAEGARLTKYGIARVHRTRLVNLTRVTGLKPGSNGDFELTLDTGQVIAGSRRYRDAVAPIEALAAHSTAAPQA